MTRVLLLTRLLLLRNKWLILLLMVWPMLIALVIHFAGAGIDRDDVTALLGQEGLYGIAMVAFAGSALLGAEERSGRVQVVLARAVRRSEYLAALFLGAWLPLLLYVAGFCAAGLLLNSTGDVDPGKTTSLWPAIFTLAGRQLCIGWTIAAASILSSVVLPTAFAATATVVVAAAAEYSVVHLNPRAALLFGLSMLFAAVFFAAACALFARQDLDLSSD
jgi:ABC-type transport system involved in multi-copper enzyme maturation permease subunit